MKPLCVVALLALAGCKVELQVKSEKTRVPETEERREEWMRRNAAELIEPYHQKVEELLEGQIGSIGYGVVGHPSGSLFVLRDVSVNTWGHGDVNIKRLKDGVQIFVKSEWRAPRMEFTPSLQMDKILPVTDVFVDGGAK